MSGMVIKKDGKLAPRKRPQTRRPLPVYTPLWNYRGKINQCGLYPVHIEIYLSREERRYYEVQVPQKIARNEWAGKADNWVKHIHPFAFEINNQIRDTLNILTELNKRYYTMKKPLTMPLVFKELNKDYNLERFNAFFKNVILSPPENLDEVMMKRYDALLKKLDKFNPSITFAELSEQLFEDFKKFLE